MPPAPKKLLLPVAALALILAAAAGAAGRGAPALSLGWYGAACDDAEAQNPGDPAGCRYDAREDQLPGWGGQAACQDGVDNDSDEKTDCVDPDCTAPGLAGESYCGRGTSCERTERDADGDCAEDWSWWGSQCSDGQDNDGDGYTDGCDSQDCWPGDGGYCAGTSCGDASCNGTEDSSSCPTDCGCPWWNPNCWGSVSCGDGACGAGEDCASCSQDCGQCGDPTGGNPGGDVCGDGTCQASESCTSCQQDCGTCGAGIEDCSTDADDDGDGNANCADSDCANDPSCLPAACGDNLCNVSAGECSTCVEDCSEWDCGHEGDCANGFDDDSDGLVDCADVEDCDYAGSYCHNIDPEADCWDESDNDSDGATDCADTDCYGAEYEPGEGDPRVAYPNKSHETQVLGAVTVYCDANGGGVKTLIRGSVDDPAMCANGADDDGDGATDCADSDCDQSGYCS